MRSFRVALLLSLVLTNQWVWAQNDTDSPIIHGLSAALTDVMIVDGFSPPQASRVYYYCHVGYYEVIRQKDDSYLSLSGQLNGLSQIDEVNKGVNLDYAAAIVFKNLGNQLVYHGESLNNLMSEILTKRFNNLDQQSKEQSIAYANKVYASLQLWIKADNYSNLKTMPRYQLIQKSYAWEPTPPAYHDALEPNWYFLRTATLDSAAQFIAEPHIPFDTSKTSAFYKETMDVYDIVNELSEEKRVIAKFWDCNPMQTQIEGHFTFAAKQMTPGGHWMAIAGIASSDRGLGNIEVSSIYTNVAIGLFDGFISSWKAKFVYDLIRPETYINRYIDPNWRPILETPPFPEYTSAHSVISMTAAQILNNRIGTMTYVDTVETRWGYPKRTFNSFIEAAQEVSDSRVYGGIHYRMGVDFGIWQGNMLGKHINEKVQFRVK